MGAILIPNFQNIANYPPALAQALIDVWGSMTFAQKVTLTIDDTITGSADTNGTACTPINIGAALPARAYVVGVEVVANVQGAGGSVVSAALDVGWSGATQAIVKGIDLVAATVGSYDQNKGGTAQTRSFPMNAGSKQLTAIVTPDGSHQLSALTALNTTINVYYVVPIV